MTGAGGPLILVVEDDRDVGRLICSTLEGYGYRTEHFVLARDLMNRLRHSRPALVIVDLGLPDRDGLQVVRDLQEAGSFPIIILTGRGHTSDRVLGLEFGADDYVVKPFEPRELVARVRSVLRRFERAAEALPAGNTARFAGWSFETESQTLTAPDGTAIVLGTAESDLLKALLRRPNRILSRAFLLDLKGDAADPGPFDRSIDVRMSRLRKRLGEDPHDPRILKTIYGAGYMLCAQVGWE